MNEDKRDETQMTDEEWEKERQRRWKERTSKPGWQEEWQKEIEQWIREMNSLDLSDPSDAETVKYVASIVWKPEETIQEFYEGLLSEMEWNHNGYGYYIDHTVPGWDIYYRNWNDAKEVSAPYWEVCPHEHFETRLELAFNFKLKNDGRTPAEYICDYYGKPRILVPPVPEYLPNV